MVITIRYWLYNEHTKTLIYRSTASICCGNEVRTIGARLRTSSVLVVSSVTWFTHTVTSGTIVLRARWTYPYKHYITYHFGYTKVYPKSKSNKLHKN